MQTLDDVTTAYAASRAEQLEHCEAEPPDVCKYCGKWWRKWNGSQLDGHAQCVVTRVFKGQLAAFMNRNPAITYAKMGEVLGVSASVIRSWVAPRSGGRR